MRERVGMRPSRGSPVAASRDSDKAPARSCPEHCQLPTGGAGSMTPPPPILLRFGSYQSDADQKKDGRKQGLGGFWLLFLSPAVVPPWFVAPCSPPVSCRFVLRVRPKKE